VFCAPIICWKIHILKKPFILLSGEGIFYHYCSLRYQEGELLRQYYVRVGKSGRTINLQRYCVVAKAWLTFCQFQIFQWKVINIFPPHHTVIHIWHGVRWINNGDDNPILMYLHCVRNKFPHFIPQYISPYVSSPFLGPSCQQGSSCQVRGYI
jgi:hypothetical protein